MCGFLGIIKTGHSSDEFKQGFSTLGHRGPDDHAIVNISNEIVFGFHRLAIRDTSASGNQPFQDKNLELSVMCNGEIYNYESLRDQFKSSYHFHSSSDCEVLLPLLSEYDILTAAKKLDAEFAFLAFDHKTGRVMAARDPIGIRPLFYGYKNGGIAFASEAKALHGLCDEVKPFPPGFVYTSDKGFEPYIQIEKVDRPVIKDMDLALQGIKDKLVAAVEKRLHSDVPVGFLLSGGLDSSLVCSIAARLSDKPIRTFAIGTKEDAIDIKYAEQVAKHIGSIHTNVYFTPEEALAALPHVVRHLETWDITTVRAAVGMYLVCEHIGKETDIKVLLTGEVSDEIFGYKYTDYAPSAKDFQMEAEKRLRELYVYDVLRADRSIAAHSLEARVPFADIEFVRHVMAIDPELKMNRYNKGKYLLRQAFAEGEYLPYDLLMREKAAFSDAVGHSMVDNLKLLAEQKYTELDLKKAQLKYPYRTPFTKESLMYRDIFEEYYDGRAEWIDDFWMPNKTWENCNVDDPSARVLPNYGKSGA